MSAYCFDLTQKYQLTSVSYTHLAGITAVEGRFSRGEVVKIKNTSGKVIALGMPRYNSDALEDVYKRQASYNLSKS